MLRYLCTSIRNRLSAIAHVYRGEDGSVEASVYLKVVFKCFLEAYKYLEKGRGARADLDSISGSFLS